MGSTTSKANLELLRRRSSHELAPFVPMPWSLRKARDAPVVTEATEAIEETARVDSEVAVLQEAPPPLNRVLPLMPPPSNRLPLSRPNKVKS